MSESKQVKLTSEREIKEFVESAEKNDSDINRQINLVVMRDLEKSYPHAFLRYERGCHEYCLVLESGDHIKYIIGAFGLVILEIEKYLPIVSPRVFDLTRVIFNLLNSKEPNEGLNGIPLKKEYIEAYTAHLQLTIDEIRKDWRDDDYGYPENRGEYWSLYDAKTAVEIAVGKNQEPTASYSVKKCNFGEISSPSWLTSELRNAMMQAERDGALRRASELLSTLTSKPKEKFHFFQGKK